MERCSSHPNPPTYRLPPESVPSHGVELGCGAGRDGRDAVAGAHAGRRPDQVVRGDVEVGAVRVRVVVRGGVEPEALEARPLRDDADDAGRVP